MAGLPNPPSAHIPHASTQFPESSGHTFSELDGDEGLLIDYYTDELFSPEQETEHILSVVFPYCRLYCDVERLINDPLDTDGLGFHYDRFISFLVGGSKLLIVDLAASLYTLGFPRLFIL